MIFILLLKILQLWPQVNCSGYLLYPFDIPILFLCGTFSFDPGIIHFSKEPQYWKECWYSETKIWALLAIVLTRKMIRSYRWFLDHCNIPFWRKYLEGIKVDMGSLNGNKMKYSSWDVSFLWIKIHLRIILHQSVSYFTDFPVHS